MIEAAPAVRGRALVGRGMRVVALALLAVLLVGGWVYLYLQARAVDLRVANDVLASLRELKEADTRWNDRLISNRIAATEPANGVASAAQSNVHPATVARIQAALAAKAYQLGNVLSPQDLAALKQDFDRRATAVDGYFAASRATIDAGNAFGVAADALVVLARSAGPKDSGLAALGAGAERARQAVLTFMAQPDKANAVRASDTLDALDPAAVPEAAHAEVAGFVASGRTLVAARLAEDDRFRAAYFATTGARLDTLTRAFEREFGNAIDEAERYRVYLLFYSGLLLALAAYLGWRLAASYRVISRVNEQLREANESLERRVAERTRELSQALAQLKESESMLIQSEKMSSLGQMVAGVAHEVNTPLAYVKSSLEAVGAALPRVGGLVEDCDRLVGMLQAENVGEAELSAQFAKVSGGLAEQRAGGFGAVDGLLQDGLHGIERIAELVTNLKNFSRVDRSKVSAFDLNDGVRSAIAIGRNELKAKTLHEALGDIPKVSCSPSQINQVFLNLLTNAAQATPEQGGAITVRSGRRDAEHVFVEIEDNGHGIPDEVLPKIFDPFFTTKEIGRGTGLGLSICYKIVQQHGGRIEVASKAGRGTRFTVVLPVAGALAA